MSGSAIAARRMAIRFFEVGCLVVVVFLVALEAFLGSFIILWDMREMIASILHTVNRLLVSIVEE